MDILSEIIDRPACKVTRKAAVVRSTKPPTEKTSSAQPSFTPFERKSLPFAVSGGASLKKKEETEKGKKNEKDKPKRPEKPALTLQQQKEKRERLAALRAANRGDLSLDAVSEVVKRIEVGAPRRPPPSLETPSAATTSAGNRFNCFDATSTSARFCNSTGNNTAGNGGARKKIQFEGRLAPQSDSSAPVNTTPCAPTGTRSKQEKSNKTTPQRPRQRPISGPKKMFIGGVPQPPPRPPVRPVNGQVLFGSSGVSQPQLQRGGGNHNTQGDDDEDEEEEDDLADFIDDTPVEGMEWQRELRGLTGYYPSRFDPVVDEGEAMESSAAQQACEEKRSAKVAALEDAEELRRIQEEEKAEAERRKRRRV